MGFLDRLLGRAPRRNDPTRAWSSLQPPMPDFDVERMAFGPLRFGDPLEAAAVLGRPDHFAWLRPSYGMLLYGARGFQIDFDAGRFAYVAFFIGPDAGLPKEVPITFSEPCLTGLSNGPLRLTRSLDRSAVERWFGPTESDVENGDETVLFYQRQGVEMEFEFDGRSGELKRWNAFPWHLDSQGGR